MAVLLLLLPRHSSPSSSHGAHANDDRCAPTSDDCAADSHSILMRWTRANQTGTPPSASLGVVAVPLHHLLLSLRATSQTDCGGGDNGDWLQLKLQPQMCNFLQTLGTRGGGVGGYPGVYFDDDDDAGGCGGGVAGCSNDCQRLWSLCHYWTLLYCFDFRCLISSRSLDERRRNKSVNREFLDRI